MRSLIFVALTGLLAGTPVAAGETISPAAIGEAIQVNSSVNAQIFVANETEPQIQEQERSLKQSMYERAIGECELLRASIARSCRMTSISRQSSDVLHQCQRHHVGHAQIVVAASA